MEEGWLTLNNQKAKINLNSFILAGRRFCRLNHRSPALNRTSVASNQMGDWALVLNSGYNRPLLIIQL